MDAYKNDEFCVASPNHSRSIMKLHVHLGAHKTATTFIQSHLHDQRAVLAEAGIGVVPIHEIRRDFTASFEWAHRFDPFWFFLVRPFLRRRLDRLQARHPGEKLLILSEENIAGLLRLNSMRGGLYPSISARIGVFDGLLTGRDRHYFFAIRNYADHIVSTYLQMAMRGRVPSFDVYRRRLGNSDRGWASVISDLARIVGPERVTVWTYERFKDDPAAIIGRLAPGAALETSMDALARDVLPSLSAKGFRALKALSPMLTAGERQRMAKLLRNFPFESPNERIEITDQAFLARMTERYATDKATIRALGVELLDIAEPVRQD